MDVGQIDFPDMWCESKVTLRPKAIPHLRFPTDSFIPSVLKEGPLIGCGRFGQVFQMLDRKSQKEVAVKTIKRYFPENVSNFMTN
jgi:hypothetical protein